MKDKKGFTLIELLGVIILLAILLIIVTPNVVKYIKKGKISYYTSIEEQLSTAGANYMEDYRTLLPKQVGHVRVVSIEELVSNKYIDEIKDENGNKCTGRVVIEKTKKDSYDYNTCLICGEDGKYYKSDQEICDKNEGMNKYADSANYTLVVEPGPYEVPLGEKYVAPVATVYYNGEPYKENGEVVTVKGIPDTITAYEIKEYPINYYYHGAIETIKVVVNDTTPPSTVAVVLRRGSEEGKIYKTAWSNVDLYAQYKATDYTEKGVSGSGISHYEVSNDGINWDRLTNDKEVLSEEGIYTRYVRAVDNSGNYGPITTYSFQLDKTPPTCTWMGESTNWIREGSRTIVTTCHDDGLNGIATSGCTAPSLTKSWTYENSIKTDDLSHFMHDEAGNFTDCAKVADIYIDKEIPSISPKATTLELKDDVQYTFTSNLNTKDEYSGIASVTCDPPTTQFNCAYNVSCTIVDVAGNTNSTSFRTQHYYNDIAYPATCSREVEYCAERSDECNCCSWAWDSACQTWGGGTCAPSQVCMRDGGGDNCCSHGTRSESYDCTKYTCSSSKPANHDGGRHICIHNCGLLCNEKITPVSTELTGTRTLKVTTSHSGADLQYKIEVASDPSQNREWTPISNNGTIKLEYNATPDEPIVVHVKDYSTSCAEVTYTETNIDRTKPAKPTVILKTGDESGEVYNGDWYSGDIYAEFESSDNSSGIDYYKVSPDNTAWTQITGNNILIEKNGNEKWYVRSVDKVGNESESAEFITKIDKVDPEIETDEPIVSVSKIKIPYTATDEDSGVDTVTLVYGLTTEYGETATNTDNAFEWNSRAGKLYYYKVTVVDKAGNTKEITGEVRGGEFPPITFTGDPNQDEWTTSRTVTVTGESSFADLQYKITYTSTPERNVTEWTTIPSGTKFIFDELTTSTNPITIYARFADGEDVSDVTTYVETKIDTTKPLVNTGQPQATSNSTTIPLNVSDPESGIEKTVCEYGTTENGFNVARVETTTNTCTFTDLDKDPTYYYKITTYNNAGLERFMYLFEYTHEAQTFNAEVTGMYKIEAYGAGGSGAARQPGRGSLAEAKALLTNGTDMYVYVGGTANLYNGGGVGGADPHMDRGICGSSVNGIYSTNGSGATDIRMELSEASDGWSGNNTLLSRLVTAGGGGGARRTVGRRFNGATPLNACAEGITLGGEGTPSSNGVLGQGSSDTWSTSALTDTGDRGWSVSGGGGGGYYGGQTAGVNVSRQYNGLYCNVNNSCTPCNCGSRWGFLSVNNNRMVGAEIHAYAGTSYIKNGYTYGNRIFTFSSQRTQADVNNGNGYLKIIEDDLESGFCTPVFGSITVTPVYDTDIAGILGIDQAEQTYAKKATISITASSPTNGLEYKVGIDDSWHTYTGPFNVTENTTIYARESGCDVISNASSLDITGIYIPASDVSYQDTTVQDVIDDIYERLGE